MHVVEATILFKKNLWKKLKIAETTVSYTFDWAKQNQDNFSD